MNSSAPIQSTTSAQPRWAYQVIESSLRPGRQPTPAKDQNRKRILLVDDDYGVQELLGRVLESEHYEVIHARTGNAAARQFVTYAPDLVLLDLNMPERDGWSAFRFMNSAQPTLPVVIITARPDQYPEAAALKVDALMEKPLNLPVLLQTIQHLVYEPEQKRKERLNEPGFKTLLLTTNAQPGSS